MPTHPVPAAERSCPDKDDPRWAYLQWLFYEHRLLQEELMGDIEGRLSPIGTFAAPFHFPSKGGPRDLPPPSTWAVTVMRAAGVAIPEGVQ